MKYRVLMKVVSSVGVVSGYCSDYFDLIEDAYTERDHVQEVLRNCEMFTIFSEKDPSVEISLSIGIIKNSIFEFYIVDQE